MAFSGVRSSWLMLARNCDLCWLASASCRLLSWIPSNSRTFSIAIAASSAKVILWLSEGDDCRAVALHGAPPPFAEAPLRPMPLLGGRLILEDQAEQEMHVAAVGSAFRRLGSIGSPHLAHVPYVPSDIRFRAASI
jgi:hypothetical protein